MWSILRILMYLRSCHHKYDKHTFSQQLCIKMAGSKTSSSAAAAAVSQRMAARSSKKSSSSGNKKKQPQGLKQKSSNKMKYVPDITPETDTPMTDYHPMDATPTHGFNNSNSRVNSTTSPIPSALVHRIWASFKEEGRTYTKVEVQSFCERFLQNLLELIEEKGHEDKGVTFFNHFTLKRVVRNAQTFKAPNQVEVTEVGPRYYITFQLKDKLKEQLARDYERDHRSMM